MFVILFAESSKLCLKDLSDDVTYELTGRLQADEAPLEKFYQFFGLKLRDRYPLKGRFPLYEIKNLFPDTTVNVLKECFEVLQLYDLVEILEKVKPRSLRPAVSPEQIEKLRGADDRPTKYHSNVAVLVVDFTVEEDIVEREDAEKIETFFKDLNSRNEVTIISSSRDNRNAVREMKEINYRLMMYPTEERLREDLRRILNRKALLEKELEEVMQKEKVRKERLKRRQLEQELTRLKQQELTCRGELEKLEELTKEIIKPISTALNELIHKQGWLTSFSYIHAFWNKIRKGSFDKTLLKERIKVTINNTLKIIERRKKIFVKLQF